VIFGSPLSFENALYLVSKRIGKRKAKGLLSGMTIAAIGATTAKSLSRQGLEADIVPKRYTFNDVVKELERRL
jgi:uroporphyrinogen-III synthase